MPNEPTCLDPAQCALLVMDYQPVVLGSMSDSDALVSRTNQAIDILRTNNAGSEAEAEVRRIMGVW